MLKRCLPHCYLGSPCVDGRDSRSRELEAASSISLDWTLQSKNNIFVRVVHAGGKVDHYPEAVLASKLLEKLPGKRLALPQVFQRPHESLIAPEEYLLPGHKYYVIPLSTLDKLKRKHNQLVNRTIEKPQNVKMTVQVEAGADQNEDYIEESFCFASDFYVGKEKWSRSCSVKKESEAGGAASATTRSTTTTRNLPSLPKPNIACRGYTHTWEPSLSSIQEVSP